MVTTECPEHSKLTAHGVDEYFQNVLESPKCLLNWVVHSLPFFHCVLVMLNILRKTIHVVTHKIVNAVIFLQTFSLSRLFLTVVIFFSAVFVCVLSKNVAEKYSISQTKCNHLIQTTEFSQLICKYLLQYASTQPLQGCFYTCSS